MLKKTQTTRLTLSLCLFVFASCAPVEPVALPGGIVGPVDEAAVLGVWTYEVTGSCYLLRGDLYITTGQSGLSGRLTEKPFAANDPFERQKDQQRCPRRARPATINLDQITYNGGTLVFSGAADPMTSPFSLRGQATVNNGTMRGTLSIIGSLAKVGRNEVASLNATRAGADGQQPLQADKTRP